MSEGPAASADPKEKAAADQNREAAERTLARGKEERKENVNKVMERTTKPEKKVQKIKTSMGNKDEESDPKTSSKNGKKKKTPDAKEVERVVKKIENKATQKLNKVKKKLQLVEKEVEKFVPMSHGTCFLIVPLLDNGRKSDYALTIDPKDAYAPKHKTGVHNISLKSRFGEDFDRRTQHWHYNVQTRAIHSEYFKRKTLFEGGNKNLIVFTWRNMV